MPELAMLADDVMEVEGIQACGVCLGTRCVLTRPRPDGLTQGQVETVCKAMAETFGVLKSGNLRARRLNWSFSIYDVRAVRASGYTMTIMLDKTVPTEKVESFLRRFFETAMETAVA
jgi:hypothetical protein